MSRALVVSMPQFQNATAEPGVIAVPPVALAEGWSKIAMPLDTVLIPVTTTRMVPGNAEPAPLVWIAWTYFDTCPAEALDSQPQKPPAGRAGDACAVSVTL